MAFMNRNMNEIFWTVLILSALLSKVSAVDCQGKSFHCVNSTHFMICVDLGGGVSQSIDDFYIACPPPTVCQGTNHFECEFPAPTTPSTTLSNVISETTQPWEEVVTATSPPGNTTKEFSEKYMKTETITTVAIDSFTTEPTFSFTTEATSDLYLNNESNTADAVNNLNSTPDVSVITEEIATTIANAVPEEQAVQTVTPATVINLNVTDTVPVDTDIIGSAAIETVTPATEGHIAAVTEATAISGILVNLNVTDTVFGVTEGISSVVSETVTSPTIENMYVTDIVPVVTEEITALVGEPVAKVTVINLNTTNTVPEVTLEIASAVGETVTPPIVKNLNITHTVLGVTEDIRTTAIDTVTSAPIKYNNVTGTASGVTVTQDTVINLNVTGTVLGETEDIATVAVETVTSDTIKKRNVTDTVLKVTEGIANVVGNTKTPATVEYLNVTDAIPAVAENIASVAVETVTVDNLNATDTGPGVTQDIASAVRESVTPLIVENSNVTHTVLGVTKDIGSTAVDTVTLATIEYKNVADTAPGVTVQAKVINLNVTDTVLGQREDFASVAVDTVTLATIETKNVTDTVFVVTEGIAGVVGETVTLPILEYLNVTDAVPAVAEDIASVAVETVTVVNLNATDTVPGVTEDNAGVVGKTVTSGTFVNLNVTDTVSGVTEGIASVVGKTVTPAIVEYLNVTDAVTTVAEDIASVAVETVTFVNLNATDTVRGATEEIVSVSVDTVKSATIENNNVTDDASGVTVTQATLIDLNLINTALGVTEETASIPVKTVTSLTITNLNATDTVSGVTEGIASVAVETVTPGTFVNLNATDTVSGVTEGISSVVGETVTPAIVEYLNVTDAVTSVAEDIASVSVETVTFVNLNATDTVPGATADIVSVAVDTVKSATIENINVTDDASGVTVTQATLIDLNLINTALGVTEEIASIPVKTVTSATIDNLNATDTVPGRAVTQATVINRNVTDTVLKITENIASVVQETVTQLTVEYLSVTDFVPIEDFGSMAEESGTSPTIENLNVTDTVPGVIEDIATAASEVVTPATDGYLSVTDILPTITDDASVAGEIVNSAKVKTQDVTYSGVLEDITYVAIVVNLDVTDSTVTEDISSTAAESVSLAAGATMNVTKGLPVVEHIASIAEETVTPAIVENQNVTDAISTVTENVVSSPTETVPLATDIVSIVGEKIATTAVETVTQAIVENQNITDTLSAVTEVTGASTTETAKSFTAGDLGIPVTVPSETKGIANTIEIPVGIENINLTKTVVTGAEDIATTEHFTQPITDNTESPVITPLNQENISTDGTLLKEDASIFDKASLDITSDIFTTKPPILVHDIKENILNVGTPEHLVKISTKQMQYDNNNIQLTTEKFTTRTEHLDNTMLRVGELPSTIPFLDHSGTTEKLRMIDDESLTTHTTVNYVTEETIIPTTQRMNPNIITTVVKSIPTISNINVMMTEPTLLASNKVVPKLGSGAIVAGPKRNLLINFGTKEGKTVDVQDKAPNFISDTNSESTVSNQTSGKQQEEKNPLQSFLIDKTIESLVSTNEFRFNRTSLLENDRNLYVDSKLVPQTLDNIPTVPTVDNPNNNLQNTVIKQESVTFNGQKGVAGAPKSIATVPTFGGVTYNSKTGLIDNSNTATSFTVGDATSNLEVKDTVNAVATGPIVGGATTHSQGKIADIAKTTATDFTTGDATSKLRTGVTNSHVTVTANTIDVGPTDDGATNNSQAKVIDRAYTITANPIVEGATFNLQVKVSDSASTILMEPSPSSPFTAGSATSNSQTEFTHKANTIATPVIVEGSTLQTGIIDVANTITRGPTARGTTINSQTKVFDAANIITTVPPSVGGSLKSQTDKIGDIIKVQEVNFNTQAATIAGVSASPPAVQNVAKEMEQSTINLRVIPRAKPSTTSKHTPQNPIRSVSAGNTGDLRISLPQLAKESLKSELITSHHNSTAFSTVNSNHTSHLLVTEQKYVLQNTTFTIKKETRNSTHTDNTSPPHQEDLSAAAKQTQKRNTAYNNVRIPQSVPPNPISHATNIIKKQVATDAIPSHTCMSGIRGRYSDKGDCRKFYICVGNSQPIVGFCPENTVFSDLKKQCTKNMSHCIRDNEFKCPSAGRFSDFLNDIVYYICISYKDHLYRFKFQCQKGYILNKATVKCVETREIESNESVSISSDSNSDSITAKSSTSSRNTGITSNSASDRNSTSGDNNSSKNNGGDRRLDKSSRNNSSKRRQSSEGEETIQSEDNDDADDEEEVFICKKEGKFPIPNDCRRYYLCKKKRTEFRRKVKKCESGDVFHKSKKKCVDADSYEC